ncbi:sodium-translocating pyrophosphatase [Candidatus Woesearchaeota archaeon]|nr:sodium-translocating pyrophosphatase [Candidatus Woesearchaeota archaeon]
MLELVFGASAFSLIVALLLAIYILKKPAGTAKMQEISGAIHKGALTFLKKEYEVLVIFLIIVAVILYFFLSIKLAISFVIGGISSALAGNIGMRIATKANSRTTEATKVHIGNGLRIAFYSGAVMGLCVVGIGLLGVSLLYLVFKDPNLIYGFGFGASSIALFARVGGGIYTKAADVGADLVGKVEKGIPEDDPRNPAVIADNVGDNVGDVAGMGADLFESYVNSIIAAMVLGMFFGADYLILPLRLAALGILASIIGIFFVKAKDEKHLFSALNIGLYISTVLAAIFSFVLVKYQNLDIGIFYAALAGLAVGVVIGLFTEYMTSNKHKPTQSIAVAAKTGAGTNVIQGLAIGMLSTLVPVISVSIAVLIAYKFAGLYGIAIAGVGMLATLGFTLAIETYGAVADNAAGISEMANVGKNVREKTELLDAVGNTTAAIGKGFAIGSAALTALALFASFTQITKIEVMSISNPDVIVGLFIGGMLPFLFSSFAMQAVGKAASCIVNEARRQWKTIKGLAKGKAKPDYERCIAISTRSALKQMVVPSLLAIFTPIIVGYVFGLQALGGLLVGSIVTGFSLAIFMANSGGAWDNAKKYIEAGNFGGKGSDAHKAAVVGDTVGDPFKDTAGPSLNILIKLMSIVAIVFVPLFL